MSDYIKKSELIKSLTKYKFGAISNDEEREYTKEMVLVIANGLPTLDEKEIIRKPFERVMEGLKLLKYRHFPSKTETIEKAIEIVKEECGISE